jgi:hypothetical protein
MALGYHLTIVLHLDTQESKVFINQEEGKHMEPSIRPEDLKQMLEKGPVLLLDVRGKAD